MKNNKKSQAKEAMASVIDGKEVITDTSTC